MTEHKPDNKSVGLIILAAGASKRMGSPKQLLPYEGSNFIQHTVKEALNSACNPVVVVLGANHDLILPQVINNPVHIAINHEWPEGMASSIRTGINSILEINPKLRSVLILLCDQPFVSADQINKLIEASHITKKSIIISQYEDAAGVPALFSKEHFCDLRHLKGKEGAKKILKEYKECIYKVPFPLGDIDIDTPEDYYKIIANTLNPQAD
jgi:molybdenum cofactor cytidylyltransferase